jgi:hypothetical protein
MLVTIYYVPFFVAAAAKNAISLQLGSSSNGKGLACWATLSQLS